MQIDLTASLVDRFWKKIDKDGPIPAHCPALGPCWLWMDSRDRSDVNHYGCVYLCHPYHVPQAIYAHRLSWEIHHGPIPTGLFVLHHCDNPPCTNPAHLWLGTNADNMRDMTAKGRQARGAGNGQAKLTEAQVREIRRCHLQGAATYSTLARTFGVSIAGIEAIMLRKNWAWVKDDSF